MHESVSRYLLRFKKNIYIYLCTYIRVKIFTLLKRKTLFLIEKIFGFFFGNAIPVGN